MPQEKAKNIHPSEADEKVFSAEEIEGIMDRLPTRDALPFEEEDEAQVLDEGDVQVVLDAADLEEDAAA